jgi:hypothetical protein
MGRIILWLVCAASLQAQAPPIKGTLSLYNNQIEYLYSKTPDTGTPPLLVALAATPNEWDRWQKVVAPLGWRLALLLAPPVNDVTVKAAEAMLDALRSAAPFDETRAYLIAEGASAAGAFYLSVRAPHLWAAAAALNGDVKPAVNSDRLFAANVQNVPLLWIVSAEERAAIEPTRQKLLTNAFPFTFETTGDPLEFLGKYHRNPFPAKVDCETGSKLFMRCYWIEMTKVDVSRRNDAVRSSRVTPDIRASLDLGGFGYQVGKPGPGVLVEFLPKDYKGPLELQDRIVAISGEPIHNARDYVEFMDRATAERTVVIMVERGKERIRIPTRIVMPKREEVITVRIQGDFMQEGNDLFLISRGVSEVKLTIPDRWTPANLSWNGKSIAPITSPGCYVVTEGMSGGLRPC